MKSNQVTLMLTWDWCWIQNVPIICKSYVPYPRFTSLICNKTEMIDSRKPGKGSSCGFVYTVFIHSMVLIYMVFTYIRNIVQEIFTCSRNFVQGVFTCSRNFVQKVFTWSRNFVQEVFTRSMNFAWSFHMKYEFCSHILKKISLS